MLFCVLPYLEQEELLKREPTSKATLPLYSAARLLTTALKHTALTVIRSQHSQIQICYLTTSQTASVWQHASSDLGKRWTSPLHLQPWHCLPGTMAMEAFLEHSGNSSPPFSTGETTPGVLHLVLGSPAQETNWSKANREIPEQPGTGAYSVWEEWEK